ncbi:MAG: tetratricopeptide repeat protein [Rhodospirillales bacterium]|nr:tetratricopeptide repeat protein [Rhodospirillales bacterium]
MPPARPKDRWGNPVTAAGDETVRHLDDTLMSYLALGRDTGEHLKAALIADPGMAMAHVLKGYFFLLMGSGPLKARVPKSLEAAEAVAKSATAREQAHVEALRLWLADDAGKAVMAWEAILADHPRDVLALRLAHHAYFYQGAAGDMRASLDRAMTSWDAGVPGYGFVLGMQAFALEETGELAAAEAAGRKAVDINPDDPWAVHAVVHVMETDDRHAEGIGWIKDLEPHWLKANNFRYHLWWHRALLHLDRGETEETLRLYDKSLWDPKSDEYLDLCNDASLLLRLEILGADVGQRWRPIADKVAERTDEHILAFIDCHFLAALAGDGRLKAAREMVAGMRAKGGAFEVGAAVGDALLAYRENDHRRAARLLEDVRAGIVRMGGSHAQRDLFDLVLIDATIKSGDRARAEALLAERTAAKPKDPWSWRAYARVLRGAAKADAEARAAALAGS